MRSSLIVVCLILAVSTPAVADLYKWTDSQGQVHYADRPPVAQESQKFGPSSNVRLEQEAAEARRSLADKLSQSQRLKQVQQDAEAKRLAEQEKAQQKSERCQKARDRLNLLQQNSRVTRLNSRGEPYILDDAQRQSAIAEARQQADELCK